MGYTWRGANDGSLFKGLIQNGNVVDMIETNNYFPTTDNYFFLKVADRLLYAQRVKIFNQKIIKSATINKPEIAIFYKAAEVLPETIECLKKQGVFTVNFYPDVSFFTHGKNLAKAISCYNLVVSTKTFAKKDLMYHLQYDKVEFLPHGFDTDIHKPLHLSAGVPAKFRSDCVFVGSHSSGKEDLMASLSNGLPELSIKVWGSRWEKRSSTAFSSNCVFNEAIFGDYYSLAIQSSKISLGLLHEKVENASNGDLITARTFEIPGMGGFMLHQRTTEIHHYFEENKEIACFESKQELVDKVKYFLKHDKERESIAENGRQRAWKDHTYLVRAKQLLAIIKRYQ